MTSQSESSTFTDLLDLLRRLEALKIFYQLSSIRPESVMVTASVPGERWEIEMFGDGSIEVEVFVSSGEIGDQSKLLELFQRHGD